MTLLYLLSQLELSRKLGVLVLALEKTEASAGGDETHNYATRLLLRGGPNLMYQ